MSRTAGSTSLAIVGVLAACSTSATSPLRSLPSFVYVSDAAGPSQLYLFRNDSTFRVTDGAGNDTEPRSAAGMLVFTSDRDGNQEVYLSDTLGLVQRRLTNSAASDFAPALSPRGDEIAFSSNRSGVPRVLLMPVPAPTDTGFPTATALATGSASTVPEQSPAWSPDGSQIAFTSTRTGSSQVFVVAATGGEAVQMSHEPGGAFSPVWSADGSAILYQSGGAAAIERVAVSSGTVTVAASDTLGVGQPTCEASVCLGVTDPTGTSGAIVSYTPSSPRTHAVLHRDNNERQPAFVVAP